MKEDDNQAQLLLCESLEQATLYSKLALADDVKLKTAFARRRKS